MTKLGGIQLANFQPLTNPPQKAASAISALPALVGSTITPILYVGEQVVDGMNYWFIAEETLVTVDGTRRLILFAVNEQIDDDEPTYELLPQSVTVLA